MSRSSKRRKAAILPVLWFLTTVANPTIAQEATTPAKGMNLTLALHRIPPRDAEVAGESHMDEHVALTVENQTGQALEIPSDPQQIWRVSVHKENSDQALPWRWFATPPNVRSLPPGKTLTLEGGWQFPRDREAGRYVAEAEFLPTQTVQKGKFTIHPPLTGEVLFTGNLMGYFRLPNQQSFNAESPEKPCLAPSSDEKMDRAQRDRTHPSDDAQAFINQYQDHEGAILVGTGDNFAPNYYSRILVDAPAEAGLAPNKELWNWDSIAQKWTWYDSKVSQNRSTSPAIDAQLENGTSTIGRDNVGCFLSYMHYDAVVPGKHDFYYGPERLRQLARFMASIPTDKENDFAPVQMLAANMMIKTTWSKDHTPIPDSGKGPLLFATKYVQTAKVDKNGNPVPFRDLKIEDFTDAGFAFPWMQFIRITATGWSDSVDLRHRLQVLLCEAAPGNPDDFLKRDGFCYDQHLLALDDGATAKANDATHDAATAKLSPEEKEAPRKQDQSGPLSLVYRIASPAVLFPGHNYAICIPAPEVTVEDSREESARKAAPYCVRFSVYSPFFQFPGFGNPPSAAYRDPDPYVLREDTPAPVVVFGVVAPELLEHIGGDNFAWETMRGLPGGALHHDKRFTTKLTISDPVLSLVHLQDYFEKQYQEKHPHKHFHGIRVLLAQMSPAEARELAEHLPGCLRFDLIITEGDDALATPNQILQVKPGRMAGAIEDAVVTDRCPTGVGASGLNMRGQDFVNGALAKPATMIAVPPTHGQSPPNHLSRFLQVRDLKIKEDGHTYWNYELSGEPVAVPVPNTNPKPDIRSNNLKQATTDFWFAVCQTLYPKGGEKQCSRSFEGDTLLLSEMKDGKEISKAPWDTSEVKNSAIPQLALWAIRQKAKVDVALLQERDFYKFGFDDYLADHCITDPSDKGKCASLPDSVIDVQEVLDRIIWKGDFIKIRSVQGSVLKNMLKQSEQFAKIEKTAYMSVNETGRALVHLGFTPDVRNGGDFLINGRPLDPNALYSVATSDYIALGDTGYPDIANPPVGDPDPPASSFRLLDPISGSACDDLKRQVPINSHLLINCRGAVNPGEYYDELVNRTPDDPRKGNTSWYKFYAWTFLHGSLGQPATKNSYAPIGPDDVALQMQKLADSGMNWDFAADKLSLGFSGLTHTDSEQTLSQDFAGVQNAQVNAKHSHAFDWDANSKLTFYHPVADWFTSETLQYSSSFVSQISGPVSETQSRNQFAIDGGTYFHMPLFHWFARSKQLPQLSLVPSAHFETQVGNPLTNINLNSPPLASPSTLTFEQGRTNLLLGRLGVRSQNRKSYVEVGLEAGKSLNAIEQFNILTAPGGPVVACALKATESLTKCINGFNTTNPLTPVTTASSVRVLRHPQPRYGAYWTTGITVPINPKISYNFQESSDYFFLSSGDNSADTRFRHQLIHTFTFAVFPNLSFEPTYTMFLYENKLDYHFLFQEQYSVKINYSFDWSNLHESGQQLRYKKPSPQ